MFIIYDFICFLMVMFFLPGYFAKGKWHSNMWMRFGIFQKQLDGCNSGKDVVWIHAVSVGEVLAVAHIIEELKNQFPENQIVCSTVTKTGYAVAHENLSSDIKIIFAPLDFSFVASRFVTRLKPKLYISAETEIWPNLFRILKKKKVPIVIINGRISDRGFKNYKKVQKLLRKTIQSVSHFCMQSECDRERILQLGAEEKKATFVGNLKFESADFGQSYSRKDLGLKECDKVFLAGSTHPGENEQIIQIFLKLKDQHSELKLILVPRHVERVESVCQLIEESDLEVLKFSQFKNWKDQVLVIDQIGILRNFYSISDCVFIGKSFCVGGGQNMIEPVYAGKPTFVGPRTENFKDVMRIFLEKKVIRQVKTWGELSAEISSVLHNQNVFNDINERGPEVVRNHFGATDKTLKIICGFLENKT